LSAVAAVVVFSGSRNLDPESNCKGNPYLDSGTRETIRKCGSPTLEIIIADCVIKPPVPFPQLPQELALRQVHCSTHLMEERGRM
jgi:hypothetical protein